MQWDRIIPICVYRLSVVVPCCINYVVLYKEQIISSVCSFDPANEDQYSQVPYSALSSYPGPDRQMNSYGTRLPH